MADGQHITTGIVIAGNGMARESHEPGAAEVLEVPEKAGRVVQQYGRVGIVHLEPGAGHELTGDGIRSASSFTEAELRDLEPFERLVVEAQRLRESDEFREAKERRTLDAENVGAGGCIASTSPMESGRPSAAETATRNEYLEGTVGIGFVVVSGPGDLAVSDKEWGKFGVEAIEACEFFRKEAPPDAKPRFSGSFAKVTLDVPKSPTRDGQERENLWLTPTLEQLGHTSVLSYVDEVQRRLDTRWAYCIFVHKYPMQGDKNGYAKPQDAFTAIHATGGTYSPDNIDLLIAHETGHIFGCPDEYAFAGADYGELSGRFKIPNGNCANHALHGGKQCVMKLDALALCEYTRSHLGWQVEGPLMSLNPGNKHVIDIAQGSLQNGMNAIQWPYQAGNNQRFILRAAGGGALSIEARHSGKVLTVLDASMEDNAPVVQSDWVGGDHQQFQLLETSTGTYTLTASHSEKVLDVGGPPLVRGQHIVQKAPSIARSSQIWTFRALPIMAHHSGKMLDVFQSSTANGAQIIQYPGTGGDNQRFMIQPLEDGYVRLVALHSGKVLDVTEGSKADGAKLVQWDWNGREHQQFRIERQSDGFSKIIARHSGKVLDVQGGSLNDAVSVIQWTWHGGENQRWMVA
ncbi:RICIN domain-containing protein [Streptomyces sporangiiformans]|uniref:Ricin B lectin domain-containing protein n=1 Tax=Streptomyces sporangiiformans TaxID=2315329 RepID=A0A505D6H2_9ACTN|nr:RICIN domain-containing protein [Streptomyces sporangiiformans]TPQ18427.1 hypothetical protein FGD71_031255 [Streptomyces sporangiiformans]